VKTALHLDVKALTHSEQLNEIKTISENQPVMIFKHSTRCSISSMALHRIEAHQDELLKAIPSIYLLDLIRLRALSNEIALIFGVHHESPQILLIMNGECIYEASHTEIAAKDVLEFIHMKN